MPKEFSIAEASKSLSTVDEMIESGKRDARIFLRDSDPDVVEDSQWLIQAYKEFFQVDGYELADFSGSDALRALLDHVVDGGIVRDRLDVMGAKYGVFEGKEMMGATRLLDIACDLFMDMPYSPAQADNRV